jgi:L-lactate dehydrogenase complex protein LldG
MHDEARAPSPGASGSRERILARIRAAIGAADGIGRDVAAEYAALPRAYLHAHHDPAAHDIAALFVERAADYRAVVEQVSEAALPGAIARVLADRTASAGADTRATPAGRAELVSRAEPGGGAEPGARAEPVSRAGPAGGRFVAPAGLPADWLAYLAAAAPAVTLASDDPPLSAADLDSCAGVVTGCAVAIAETGTIVLDHGPGQGRRALTLVPDFHLVIVRHDQIAPDLSDALARMDPVRPQTMIAGPSATSDIELVRVEGVHGPRTLHVLISGDSSAGA